MPRIPRNAYFLYNDPYRLAKEGCDGRTDKNRQTIAVTLRLRFAARVNYYTGMTACLSKHFLAIVDSDHGRKVCYQHH